MLLCFTLSELCKQGLFLMRQSISNIFLTSAVFVAAYYLLIAPLFKPASRGDEAGSSIVVADPALMMPQKLEVDFRDGDFSGTSQTVDVVMDHVRQTWTTAGATLSSMSLMRQSDGHAIVLENVAEGNIPRAHTPFLVALDEATPFRYALVSSEQEGDTQKLVFKADDAAVTIVKEFEFSSKKHTVQLTLTVTPKTGTVQPRIMLPAPHVPELGNNDVYNAMVFSNRNVVQKIMAHEATERVWLRPTLIGVEDRYVVFALVGDADGFVKRGYFAKTGKDRLVAIIEGPSTTVPMTWRMTFYAGPKELASLEAVDPRLIQTLDYGFFTRSARVLLQALTMIHGVVHDYGLSIIFFALAIFICMYPLTASRKIDAARHSEFMQKMQYAKQKYAHDPEKLSQEQLELSQKYRVGGMMLKMIVSSAVPIIVFISLNKVLSNSIELYKVSFLWIHDLSLPDPLYILPALAASNVLVALSAAGTSDPRSYVKSIMLMLVIGGFMSFLPAGLTLYFATNAVATFVSTYVFTALFV